jgi:nucleoredoxin
MLRRLLIATLSLALVSTSSAAPIALKELELLVRMKTPDAEILRDVKARQLLTPLDAAAEQALTTVGASPALLQQLKDGGNVVSKEAALTLAQQEALRVAALKASREQDVLTFQKKQQLQQSNSLATHPAADTIRKMLDGKLVRLENGSLRSFSADDLKQVKIFAFYYSAFWCGPCRQFTPNLIEYYKRVKAQHPEFELIFVSADYNPASMQTYMEKTGMPFPAIKFEEIERSPIRQYSGRSIPWLVLVNAAGAPISSNAKTKQYVPPIDILNGLDTIFAQTKAAR